MKAMVLHEFNQPLVMEEVEDPKIAPDEVLVKVRACGVCFSDTKMAKGIVPHVNPPRILGHNISGEIAGVGSSQTSKFKNGDHVCVHIFVACGECFYCRRGEENNCLHALRIGHEIDGGYAEYVKAPARNVIKIPDEIPFEQAAILSDAVCTSFHALRARAQIKVGEDIAILGVGGLGIHAVQIAKAAGTRVIGIDIASRKLELARKYGADATFDAKEEEMSENVRSLTGGKGVDAVIDFVGSPESIPTALKILRRNGKLVIVGHVPQRNFEANSTHIIMEETQIIGSHGQTRQEMLDMVPLLKEKKIIPVVAATYPLTEANQVHRLIQTEDVMGRMVLIP